MPVINGFEASRQLRKNLGEKKMPVIVALTAHALEESRIKAMDAGMDHYLTKPIRRDELAKLLLQVSHQQD